MYIIRRLLYGHARNVFCFIGMQRNKQTLWRPKHDELKKEQSQFWYCCKHKREVPQWSCGEVCAGRKGNLMWKRDVTLCPCLSLPPPLYCALWKYSRCLWARESYSLALLRMGNLGSGPHGSRPFRIWRQLMKHRPAAWVGVPALGRHKREHSQQAPCAWSRESLGLSMGHRENSPIVFIGSKREVHLGSIKDLFSERVQGRFRWTTRKSEQNMLHLTSLYLAAFYYSSLLESIIQSSVFHP